MFFNPWNRYLVGIDPVFILAGRSWQESGYTKAGLKGDKPSDNPNGCQGLSGNRIYFSLSLIRQVRQFVALTIANTLLYFNKLHCKMNNNTNR